MHTIDKNIIGIKNKISDEIVQWSLSKEKFLNIVSPPYNFCDIFLKVIMLFVRNNKKVLYITNEKLDDMIITTNINKYTDLKKYAYYKDNDEYKDNLLIISSYKKAKRIEEKFDLVIYDDIKSFSSNTIEDILEVTLNTCKQCGKIITYSVEKIFYNNSKIIFPIRENGMPIIEPKFIETRINLNEDIPYVIYEYIKWSIKNNHKMIIYVPDEEKVKNVHKYISKYCEDLTRNTIMNDYIIVTDNFNNMDLKFKNVNVMVFFADDVTFDYKKLVYICAKVGINEDRHNGEAIFLGNCETDDIDKAKNVTRYFNKEAWEMKLLKI